MKRKVAISFCCALLFLIGTLVLAQEKNPPEPKPNQPPPPGLSIDNILYFILIVGLIYGVYSLKKNKILWVVPLFVCLLHQIL